MKYLFLFFLGTIIASSAQCYSYRFQTNYNLIQRSFCENCHHPLKFWQLIPILGFCIQKGKCYFCNNKIPSISTVIELVFGSLIAILLSPLPIPLLINYLFLFGWLLFLSLQDYAIQYINTYLLIIGIVINLILNFQLVTFNLHYSPIRILIEFMLLALGALHNRLGWGDVWLLICLVLIFGFYYSIIIIFIASLTALFYLLFHYYIFKIFPISIGFIPWISCGVTITYILRIYALIF